MEKHPTWIEIDLEQFKKNLRSLRSLIGKSRLCLVVKANAYGHDLLLIAKSAQTEVDALAVSCAAEGVCLREAGIELPILVLGAIHEEQIEDLIHYRLEFSLSSRYKADLVAQKARGVCRVHIEVETGMQRTGMRPETALMLLEQLKKEPKFEIVGVYSHLATADLSDDSFALEQIRLFSELVSHPLFHSIPAHLASSGAILHYPKAHLDMVRVGLLAYGYSPTGVVPEGMAPCFTLKSRIGYFKVVAKGAGIGYGRTFITQKQTRIVTIPIGYGDGYRRALSNRGTVLIRGRHFRIVGNVCMDQIMVDLEDQEAYVGEEVVLIGNQGKGRISLEEIAHLCETIPYEVLTSFNGRIPRISNRSFP